MLVILLLLVPLVLGGFSLARGYSARHALQNATAVAARQIALQPDDWPAALADVQTSVDTSLLGSAVDPGTLAFGSEFSVTCSVPFEAQIPFVPPAPRTLQTIHYEVAGACLCRSERRCSP
jgi:Flp pilus assembly protein TadG